MTEDLLLTTSNNTVGKSPEDFYGELSLTKASSWKQVPRGLPVSSN